MKQERPRVVAGFGRSLVGQGIEFELDQVAAWALKFGFFRALGRLNGAQALHGQVLQTHFLQALGRITQQLGRSGIGKQHPTLRIQHQTRHGGLVQCLI